MRLIVALLFVLLAAAQASAAPCTGWLEPDFWRAATLTDVQGCLATSPVNARNEDGFTPLHYAAGNSTTPAIVTALLDAGAEVNARTENGWTPLHVAAAARTTPAFVTALLDAGADARAVDKDGRKPLDYARDNKALAGSDAFWRLNDASY